MNKEVFRFSAAKPKENRVGEDAHSSPQRYRRKDYAAVTERDTRQDSRNEHRMKNRDSYASRSSHRSIELQSRRYQGERRPNSRYREGSTNTHSSRHPPHYGDPNAGKTYREVQRSNCDPQQERFLVPKNAHQVEPLRGTPREKVQAEIPHEVFLTALGQVREVMKQYTTCADPTESNARREHMRQAEVNGEPEEASRSMVQATFDTPLTPTIDQPGEKVSHAQKRIPAVLRLGPHIITDIEEEAESKGRRHVSLERTPAILRLGLPASTAEAGDIPREEGLVNSAKRKPGRPPGKRKVQDSPKSIGGTSTRRRKVTNPKAPPARRKLNPNPSVKGTKDKRSKAIVGGSHTARSSG